MLTGALENLIGIPGLNDIYYGSLAQPADRPFADRVLAAMKVDYDVTPADLARIPATGPLVVVANHPYGGIEGVVLASLLSRVRPQVKLLVNYLLACIPEFRDSFFFVDPFGGAAAARKNVGALREALSFVKNGGCLGVFPAGEVSHLTWRKRCVTDPAWSPTVGRIVRQTGASVLPVYFDGRNGSVFQLAGLVHPRLRTALLPRAMIRRIQKSVSFRIGSVISPQRMARLSSDEEATAYLRVRTYILKGREPAAVRRSVDSGDAPTGDMGAPAADSRPAGRRQSVQKNGPSSKCHESGTDIVPAEAPAVLAAEIDGLDASCLLCTSGAFQVYLARAPQIPRTLREIGRLRETTFRAVGEGTGGEIDIDRFDDTYLHLFLWNREAKHVAGAYRAGPTDEILAAGGIEGLYTRTLFRYDRRLLDQIGPALELGRSFIRADYQRSYAPLALLWKGIGQIAVRQPRYRMLFGPVSISDEYASMTRELLITFLSSHAFDTDLRRLVRPTNPARRARFRDCDLNQLSTIVRSIDDVDELVSEIESDRRGMPVLLRQYLNLNARLLGFNIDPDFGDVLDGLVLIDLTRVHRSILDRYMGREGARSFLACYGCASGEARP